jgi:hypothetical protein
MWWPPGRDMAHVSAKDLRAEIGDFTGQALLSDHACYALRQHLLGGDMFHIASDIADPELFDPALDTATTALAMSERAQRIVFTLIHPDPGMRELLTDTALDLSLCPLHLVDYAICFDDENPECASIRTIHPSHDT